jgi:hypothetical protein
LKKTHGGARAGAGKPKGTKNAKTLEKEAIREHIRQRVVRDLDPMLDAQIDNAKGIKHFMKRDPKTGKFERLTDPDQIVAALNADGAEEGSSYWIYAKDPSPQSWTDLANRAADKPKEQEQDLNLRGALKILHEVPE